MKIERKKIERGDSVLIRSNPNPTNSNPNPMEKDGQGRDLPGSLTVVVTAVVRE
jgi:hypothetical protein